MLHHVQTDFRIRVSYYDLGNFDMRSHLGTFSIIFISNQLKNPILTNKTKGHFTCFLVQSYWRTPAAGANWSKTKPSFEILNAPDCSINATYKQKHKHRHKHENPLFQELISTIRRILRALSAFKKYTSKGANSGGRGSTVRAAFPLYIEYPT